MEQLVQNNFPRKKVGLYELFTVININSFFNGGLPQTRTFSEEVVFHDFWEFYYVDRGTLSIELEEKSVFLEAGEGIFYSPYSKHRLTGSDSESVNIISLAFDCVNLDTDFFSNTVFALNSLEKSILSKIVKVGSLYFTRYSSDPFGQNGIKLKKDAPHFAVPFVKASIEYLLLLLYSEKSYTNIETKTAKLDLSPQIKKVVDYMYQNIYKKLALSDFAAIANMSASQFRMQFKKETSQSVIDFFNTLKIEQAKILIRENLYSFDEIALMLNYSSASYFSRQFKQKTNMTPTEFSRLVSYFRFSTDETFFNQQE